MTAERANHRLAEALERVKAASVRDVVRSSDVGRSDRELLAKAGYLGEIFKGWYFLTRPSDTIGQSTAWYATFWDFLSVYLGDLFGERYCLSAVSSLALHTGQSTVPEEIIVMAGTGSNRTQPLPFNTSVVMYKVPEEQIAGAQDVRGLRAMSLPLALVRVQATYFTQKPEDAEIALRSVRSTADLTRCLLEREGKASAGRIVGALEFLGEDQKANEIAGALEDAGLNFKASNPFEIETPTLSAAPVISPYAARITARFRNMRDGVARIFEGFPEPESININDYLASVDDLYQYDAYNSLSIEGYQVTPRLIERIRDGAWDPDSNPEDRREADAFAARGYLEAFRLVKESIRSQVAQDPVGILDTDYSKWYRGLFSAAVSAGVVETGSLAGFRNGPVFIRGSRHVPPPANAVADSFEALLDVLRGEESPIIRAVLGHFLFVFIHPFMDGNGRMGRFIMNYFLASGGYALTIVRVKRRAAYMEALETASCEDDIVPFARFLREEMAVDWSKE